MRVFAIDLTENQTWLENSIPQAPLILSGTQRARQFAAPFFSDISHPKFLLFDAKYNYLTSICLHDTIFRLDITYQKKREEQR